VDMRTLVLPMCNLANAYLQKGDLEKSLQMNRKMLELAPNFGLGYNNLANVYYLKGEIDRAIENRDKALELGFEVHPDFFEMLEQCKKRMKKGVSAKKKGKKVTQTGKQRSRLGKTRPESRE
jgi:tetratricopeptide (TPR) repeat protein